MFLIPLIVFVGIASAALGITPAKEVVNFVPGQQLQFEFTILSDKPDQEIALYTEGDLAGYTRLSKTEIKGEDRLTVYLSFPDGDIAPGEHRILVGAREIPDESQFLGVAVNVRAVIVVFVPYPGRYAEVSLNVPDANVNENLPIEAYVVNRGRENLFTHVKVNIYESDRTLLDRIDFQPYDINQGGDRYFRKLYPTSEFKAGSYLAEAVVDYGDIVIVNDTFRLGSLNVNLTNYTDRLRQKEGFQEYNLDVQSLWNNPLDEVYADVNISNGVQNVEIRTPSISLNPWEVGILSGFIDTSEMEGDYDVEFVLRYAQASSVYYGMISVFVVNYLMIGIIAGVILALIVIIGLIIYIRKLKKKVKK